MDNTINEPQMPEYDLSSEHPTIEQGMIREGIEHLTPKQKQVWDLYAYDRLTQAEIGQKLKIRQQVVQRHIKAAEARIKKYVEDHRGVYALLKGEPNDAGD